MEAIEEKKKKRITLNKILLWSNFLCIFILFLSYVAVSFSPETVGYLVLLGLAYPVILLFNIVFIIVWMFRKRRFMLLSLVAILLGFNFLTDFFNFSLGQEISEENTDRLEVMTYNVHLFGLYDETDNVRKRNQIFDVLKGESPDVLCFQEFFHSDQKNYFTTRDSLIRFLPTKYYHERYTHARNGRNYFGVALLSKYPIINKGFIPFESDVNNFCIYADIKYKGDTIRIYNAHLQSIRFKPEDYAFVEDNKNQEKIETGVKRIAVRLKKAFEKRQEQVEKIVESVRSSKHPVVLCGDFNDPPVSYTYNVLSEYLKDSFTEAGSGIGNTYNGAFPSFRIDYVMHSEEFRTLDYRTVHENLSDHFPVVVGLALKNGPSNNTSHE